MIYANRPSSNVASRSRSRHAIEPLEGRRLLAVVPSGFVDQPFGSSITSGTSMAFAPDGRLFVLQQTGTLLIYQPNGTANTALTLPVDSAGERGLLGIAFDPAFATNNFVYLYYTHPGATGDPVHNRVSRFTVSENTIATTSELDLVDLDALSGATNHNGGALNFGPDGKLYVAVGDNANSANAQSITSRKGKILRYNSDGTIPTDNPTSIAGIAGSPTGIYHAIWAAGLRNPYTFTFNPINGAMFINDVGENTYEEINVGGAGRNYGWPNTEGVFTPAGSTINFTPPFYSYQHGGGLQMGYAITGGQFYTSTAPNHFPAPYQNKYFFGDYVSDWIGYTDPAGPAVTASTISTAPNFASSAGGTVDLDVGPDGALYYLSRDNAGASPGVRRIVASDGLLPTITAGTFTRDRFAAGDPPLALTLNFSEPVLLKTPTLTLTNVTTGAVSTVTSLPTLASDGRSVRYTFASLFPGGILPDGRYHATFTSGGVADYVGNLTTAFSTDFAVLAGDVDSNGTVNFDDLLILARNYGLAGRTFAQGNVDYSADGVVDFDDLLALAKNYGVTLPAASPASASTLTPTRKRPASDVLV